MPDDYLSTTQTTGAVAVGGSATGEIETSKDFDWFAVDLVAGHTYVIGLEGADSGGGALQDPVLRGLYDADGNRIAGARDNDGGAGRDARLTFTAATTGAYYIEARGHLNQTGEYTVRVTEWVDTDAERGGAADLGDITALAGPQFPAASLDGSSDSVDYWRFTLSEARRVGLGLRQQDANADLFLEDAEGNVLYSGTAEGTANEWISQTLPAGTYFVRVEAQEEGANEFKLRYGVSAANPAVVAALEQQQQQGADEAPAFAEGSYAFDLAENADGGATSVALGAVSAADPEDSTITYSIEAGDSGGLFAIDSGTGALSYQGAGEDYESGTTRYELTVRAGDGGLHSDVTVTVNVTDLQEPEEVEPLVTQSEQSTPQTVSEPYGEDFAANISTAGRIAVGDTATGNIGRSGDRDGFAVELVAGRTYIIDLRGSPTGDGTLNDPYLRGIKGPDGSRIAGVSNDDGGEGYNSQLNFTPTESGTHYIIAGAYSGLGAYEVEVRDVSPQTAQQEETTEQAPLFAEASYAFSLAENADGGTNGVSLGMVSATDPEDGTITYSIEAGDSGGLFAIDSGTGALSYQGAGEDYESGTTSYELTVRAGDGGLHSDVTVTVNVTDVAEAPAFAEGSYAFDLAENADGALFGIAVAPVVATDPDNDRITYSIEGGDPDGLFMIDAETGLVVYLGTGEDYESGTRSYELTVRASDGGLHSDVTVNVNVTDVAEAPAFAETIYAFSLAENADGGTIPVSLGLVQATDPENSTITYSIEGGDSGGLFAIDPGTGALSYRGAGEDYESETTRYELTVRASDGGLHSDVTVNVNVTDVAETPAFAEGSYAFSLAENADGGTIPVSLGLVQATDPENSTITYSIEAGDPDGLFAIDPGTGALSYRGAGEDYESETRSYELTVRASDGGLHSDVSVTVNVTYVADVEEYVSLQQEASVSEPDGEDLPEDTSTTGRVAVGDTATGKIGTQGDRDWFAVTLEAGRIYRIDLEGSWTGAGTLVDPYLRGVYNEDHFFIVGTTVNDSGCGLNSRQTLTLDETGTYYVAAGAWGTREGTYRLSVADVTDTHTDDFAAGTGTTGAVAVGGSARGTIQHVNDRDWFAVELEAGKRYRIDLEGYDTGAGTLSDPYLRGIHDADGDRLAGTTNDDDGAGSNSRVYFTVDETGTYYVAAGGYANEKGTYTLSVTEYRDDFDAGTGTTGTVVVGGSTTGEIESPGDRDWFAVTLDAGRTYRIDLEGFFTAAGTLSVPDMQGIYDANGVLIVDITDGSEGAGYNSRVYFTAEEDATYYVAAGGYGRVVGTYTLSVTDTTDGDPDDFEAGTGTSGAVEVDGSATGDIEIFGDRDWFAVTLEAGGIYRIKLDFENRFATLYEPYVRGIHDANGILIDGTEDNKGGTGYATSRVYFTAEEAGAYYVAVGSDSDWEGAYTLSVTEIPDDFAAGTDTAGAVEVGGSETGEIEYYDDRDWFAVTLEAGRTYRIDLEGSWTGGGTLYNSYLRGIHDANGVLLADTTDNNGGAVYNSRVTFTPEEDAVYYVAAGGYVSSYSGYQAGTYTLFVTDVTDGVPDDYEAGTGTSGTVEVGGLVMGEIETGSDRDWFAVTLEADKIYRIDLKGDDTGHGTLRDPYLRGLHDADGNLLPGTTADYGGAGRNSRVEFTADDAGTYYVATGALGEGEGTYTLSVEEVL